MCSLCGTTYLHGTAHQCALGGSRAAESGDDLLGAVLGERYRIVSSLSKGGMGVIYRAQHTVLDKPLAIKIMLQPQDEGARQRFLQEAKLASLVRHPNIVDIVDFGVLSSQQPYLVMELLVGQTLADAIFQGPLSAARTCYIAAQVARGLHAVHQKGIIHRDLKPANIFIIKQEALPGQAALGTAHGEVVKVVDFGIATVVNPEEGAGGNGPSARLTTPGMVLGTAEYMSPEQAQGLKTDHRVDQYALGCIMYEMLTGRVPFQGATPAATMLKHLTEKPTPPTKIRPEIPPDLERIVLRAMSMEPNERFPSMVDLEHGLVAVFEKSRRGRVSSSTLTLPKATPRRVIRSQIFLGAGLGVGLMAAIGLVLALRKPPVVQPNPKTSKVVNPTKPTIVIWNLKSEPPGAAVVRISDGKVLGSTPLRKEMPYAEGMTTVELRLDGYQKVSLELRNDDDEAPKRAELQPVAPPKGKNGKKEKGGGAKGKPKKKAGGIRDNDDIEAIK